MKRRKNCSCVFRTSAIHGGRRLLAVYRRLHAAHGPQHWWPGDSTFEIMVGAVLTQNTAWTNVEKAITNLKAAKALSPEVIAAAPHRRLAAWLKPSGYFNIKAQRLRAFCVWLIRNGGAKRIARLPTAALRAELLQVHGIGPETADDILLYAFNRPVFVIDAYTRRLFQRLGLIQGDEAYEALRGLFEKSLSPDDRHGLRKCGARSRPYEDKRRSSFSATPMFNEYHALIVAHAKNFCRKRPLCTACQLRPLCPSHEAS